MIISASRRCDIPAFFPEWLSRRLDEGYVVVRNPMFPEKLSKLSLSPSVVDAMVFWTKNPRPMMRYLDAIDSHNIPYCFHFTLTPYGCDIEPNLPEKTSLIETFCSLSDRIGSDRMTWRYDPILISDAYDVAFHIDAFEHMAHALKGCTTRCVISFLDEDYKRVRKGNSATPFRAPTEDEMRHLAQAISASAASCGTPTEELRSRCSRYWGSC